MSIALPRPERRDRLIVGGGLAALVVLSWLYLWREATAMSAMDRHAAMGMAMPDTATWTLVEFVFLTVMWTVMMVGMMVPSAAPMILLFATLERKRTEDAAPWLRTALFLLGYLLVWSAFSVLAAAAQWALHGVALVSPMMVATSPFLGGALLVAAGVFQWTPLKQACLRTCRSPLGFLLGAWRGGARGALEMGMRHGALCLGCCWALMALLFVAGVMNLLWVAVIAAFVLAEKAFPGGEGLGRTAGFVLVAAGLALIGNGLLGG